MLPKNSASSGRRHVFSADVRLLTCLAHEKWMLLLWHTSYGRQLHHVSVHKLCTSGTLLGTEALQHTDAP